MDNIDNSYEGSYIDNKYEVESNDTILNDIKKINLYKNYKIINNKKRIYVKLPVGIKEYSGFWTGSWELNEPVGYGIFVISDIYYENYYHYRDPFYVSCKYEKLITTGIVRINYENSSKGALETSMKSENNDEDIIYEGLINDNIFEGKYYKNEIIVFDGIIKNNVYQKGKLFHDGFIYYNGEFDSNVANGKGISYRYKNTVFKGDIVYDTYSKGELIYTDGDLFGYIFNGEFKYNINTRKDSLKKGIMKNNDILIYSENFDGDIEMPIINGKFIIDGLEFDTNIIFCSDDEKTIDNICEFYILNKSILDVKDDVKDVKQRK